MTPALTITVHGIPIQQGSKVANRFGNGVRDANASRLKPWRNLVTAEALNAASMQPGFQPFTGPLEVRVCFYFNRPAYHYGTGKNATRLKPNAPGFVDKKPDLDKLQRSILDALTDAGIWRDDSLVVRIIAEKRYTTRSAGAHISITPITPPTPPATSPTDGTTEPQLALTL